MKTVYFLVTTADAKIMLSHLLFFPAHPAARVSNYKNMQLRWAVVNNSSTERRVISSFVGFKTHMEYDVF